MAPRRQIRAGGEIDAASELAEQAGTDAETVRDLYYEVWE